jgi:hypothetical protein
VIRSFFSRWRPTHLLLAWCLYWAALIAVRLGPAIMAAWRMSQRDTHGSANASVTDGIIRANISESGHATWSGSISFTHLVLLVAIPPLVLWIVWLLGTSRTNNAGEIERKNRMKQRELNAPEPRIGIIDTSSLSTSKRRVREES